MPIGYNARLFEADKRRFARWPVAGGGAHFAHWAAAVVARGEPTASDCLNQSSDYGNVAASAGRHLGRFGA